MTQSPLTSLIDNIAKRYPNTLPINQITAEELALLQGQQQVVVYVTEFLKANQTEIDRDDILRDS